MKTKKSSDFKIGEIVVYPKHGVGEITKIENMEVANIKTSFYVVKMEQSKLIIRVPLDKKDEVGLRKISSKKIIDEVYSTLKLKLFKRYFEIVSKKFILRNVPSAYIICMKKFVNSHPISKNLI